MKYKFFNGNSEFLLVIFLEPHNNNYYCAYDFTRKTGLKREFSGPPDTTEHRAK